MTLYSSLQMKDFEKSGNFFLYRPASWGRTILGHFVHVHGLVEYLDKSYWGRLKNKTEKCG
jgi:hypothetical protein